MGLVGAVVSNFGKDASVIENFLSAGNPERSFRFVDVPGEDTITEQVLVKVRLPVFK